jgi:hypothetical protein
MDRLIVPFKPQGRAKAAGESDADKAIGRLIKYIPAEIISGYMLLSGLVQSASASSPLRTPSSWTIVALGVVLTPFYLWKVGRPSGVRWWQLPISTVSFLLWAYALGGPFEKVELVIGYPYEKWFATLLAGAFSWVVALVWKPTESL